MARLLLGLVAGIIWSGAVFAASAPPTAASAQAVKPATATATATSPVAVAAGDAVRGMARFKSICGTCHSIDPTKRTIGPHLKGVVGRKAGSVEGYMYSPAMKAANWSWDAARLDPYLTRPSNVVAGTKMLNMVANPKDRADIIAYLATVK